MWGVQPKLQFPHINHGIRVFDKVRWAVCLCFFLFAKVQALEGNLLSKNWEFVLYRNQKLNQAVINTYIYPLTNIFIPAVLRWINAIHTLFRLSVCVSLNPKTVELLLLLCNVHCLSVTAVVERTVFSPLYKYKLQVRCCTYSESLCVAVVGCCLCRIWLPLNVTYISFVFIHSLFLYQCGPPHVLLLFLRERFYYDAVFLFVFRYC